MLFEVLDVHLPGAATWAYGSRVSGGARPDFDLDLVVFSSAEQARAVAELRDALDESDLPFRVEVFVWEEIPDNFQRHIRDTHIVLRP